jgi:hypothetical protein
MVGRVSCGSASMSAYIISGAGFLVLNTSPPVRVLCERYQKF